MKTVPLHQWASTMVPRLKCHSFPLINRYSQLRHCDHRFIQIRILSKAPIGCDEMMGVSYNISHVTADVSGNETDLCVRYRLHSGLRHEPMPNHESMELQVCNVTATMATTFGFQCEFLCGLANTLALAEKGRHFISADSVEICDLALDYKGC